MHEILFKGKRVDNGEWIEGGYFKWVNVWEEEQPLILVKTETGFSYNEVDPETVGQYIGVNDENGRKIFEGDIVEFTSHPFEITNIGVVTFEGGCFGIEYLLSGKWKTFHRIGHIEKVNEMGFCGEITYTYKQVGNFFINPERLGGAK